MSSKRYASIKGRENGIRSKSHTEKEGRSRQGPSLLEEARRLEKGSGLVNSVFTAAASGLAILTAKRSQATGYSVFGVAAIRAARAAVAIRSIRSSADAQAQGLLPWSNVIIICSPAAGTGLFPVTSGGLAVYRSYAMT